LKIIQKKIQESRFAEAVNDCKLKLNESLDDQQKSEILYLMAVAYRFQQKFDQAIETTQILIDIAPNHARVRQERGYNYLAKGQQEHALINFSEAVKINPALLSSWQNLQKLHATTKLNKNKNKNKKKKHENLNVNAQVEYLQQLPQELLAVSEMLHDGQLLKAENLCRHFLQNNKHHIDAMRMLAEIGIELKIYDDAEFLLESCVEIAPENIMARAQYLSLLITLGKYRKAKEQVNFLLKKQPNNFRFLVARGSVLIGLGQIEEGISLFKNILSKDSNRSGVYLELGHAFKTKGDFSQAVKSYQRAYQLKPGYGEAYWSLANTKTYEFSHVEIDDIRRLLTDDKLSDDDQSHLCFAIGKALEDRKQYNDAFSYYKRGNEIKKKLTGYKAEFTDTQVEQQIKYCTTDLFKNKANLGLKDPAPIFIVGLPRAGSTLLEQILASHSQVDGTMELHNILGLAMKLRGRVVTTKSAEDTKYPKNLSEIDESYFKRFGEQFIKETQVYRADAPLFIDKMPNNFLHIGLIKLILPNAKIIDARRAPMACCFSGFKQLFGAGQDFTYGLQEIGSYYNSYLKLMNHWDDVLPGFVLRVQHEDVVDDLEKQVRRILDFCGLQFEPSCLEFYKTKRNIKTPSSEQVRQPIYKNAIQHWKNFESNLEPLKVVLGGEI
jgi:tetratricopeptide (TPR) repeat protein